MANLITAEQAAERLAMAPRWCLAEARAGRLPHYRIGRSVRFDPEELDAWRAEHHRPATIGLRIVNPATTRKPVCHAVSRGRVPSVTPPARLYPAESGAR